MYRVRYTKKFSKSLRRLIRGGLKKSIQNDIENTVTLLSSGQQLDPGYQDHQLKGEFRAYRECHIQGDLLLIYRIVNDELILVVVDIGSHSELFG